MVLPAPDTDEKNGLNLLRRLWVVKFGPRRRRSGSWPRGEHRARRLPVLLCSLSSCGITGPSVLSLQRIMAGALALAGPVLPVLSQLQLPLVCCRLWSTMA